jgi:hypothetical protein
MNTRNKILIGSGAAVLVAGLVVAIAVQSGTADEPVSKPTPTSTSVAQLPTNTSSPTADPGAGAGSSAGGTGGTSEEGFGSGAGGGDGQTGEGEGLDLPDSEVVLIPNLRDFRDTAEATVRAYATVTPGETTEARAKRLAPYFPAGSVHLTEKPRIANPQSYSGIVATVTPLPTIASSAYPDPLTETAYTFTVTMEYKGVYDADGNKMTIQKLADWTVTMNPAFDGLVQTITEPYDLR